MNIIREPKVYLVGVQHINQDAMSDFLHDHNTRWVQPGGDWPNENNALAAAEEITEIGGRLCYMSFATPRPGGNAAYLQNIKESGHGSVLEHAVYNLLITGVSRTLTHELVRHRAGVAYSQLSQRYVDESVAEYVEPDIIASDPELHSLWVQAVTTAHEAYIELVDKIKAKLMDTQTTYKQLLKPDVTFAERWVVGDGSKTELTKLARQAARSVLPNATETKILFTANARALRHFLEMRGSRFAEPEIRKLANKILNVVDNPPNNPPNNLFSDYACNPLSDGTWEIVTPFRKV